MSEMLDWAEAEIKRRMELRTKALQLQALSQSRSGWWPLVRESYPGAWQANQEVNVDTVLTNPTIFSCATLAASDVAKLRLRLVQMDDNGIWTETYSPAYSPVLRKPNRFQHILKFVEQWIISKLVHGNAYVLLQRNQSTLVMAMYVLDPTRVTPLISTDGSVFYELKRDDMSGLSRESVTVPASEIIHDTAVSIYHPLIGVSPIYACGLAALQGLAIQTSSNSFFQNGSNPGGVLTAPGSIGDATAARLKAYWEENYTGQNIGRIAVLGDGLKYEPMSVNAVDAELINQLKWTDEKICSCFHIPAYLVGVGPPPPYANVEPLLQSYYSSCVQSLLTSFEMCLDQGLGLSQGKIEGKQLGTEFDIDDLIWMDTATRTKAAGDAIGSGALSPNEARKKYYGVGPVKGGDSPYMQNQMWPLQQLSERPSPSAPALPAMPTVEPTATEDALPKAANFGPMSPFASMLFRTAVAGGILTDAA